MINNPYEPTERILEPITYQMQMKSRRRYRWRQNKVHHGKDRTRSSQKGTLRGLKSALLRRELAKEKVRGVPVKQLLKYRICGKPIPKVLPEEIEFS